MAHFFDALQVHFQFLRRNIETNVVACLYQKTLQARQREDIFDMVIVKNQHQLRRERPHPFVHHDRIVNIELQPVINIIESVIKVDRSLRHEQSRQTHIAAFAEGVLRLFDQFVAQHPERIEMKFGVRIGCGKVDRVFRAAEMAVVAAIEQFALGVCKVEEWCFIRLDIAQRHNVKVDIGDFAPAVRHFVTQDAFRLNPVVFRRFPYDHQQVIGHGVAMACAADQFPEKQNIFGVEIIFRQALDDPGGFGGIVEFFRWLFGLRFWLWSELPGRLFRRGYGLLFGLGVFGGLGLRRLFLHGVLIRFHLVDC